GHDNSHAWVHELPSSPVGALDDVSSFLLRHSVEEIKKIRLKASLASEPLFVLRRNSIPGRRRSRGQIDTLGHLHRRRSGRWCRGDARRWCGGHWEWEPPELKMARLALRREVDQRLAIRRPTR